MRKRKDDQYQKVAQLLRCGMDHTNYSTFMAQSYLLTNYCAAPGCLEALCAKCAAKVSPDKPGQWWCEEHA